MKKARILSLALVGAMALTGLTACGKSSSGNASGSATGSASGSASTATQKPSYTFKYAELNPDGHIMDEAADYFAQVVSEKSGGRITIEVFPAGQLGDEKTVYQTLQLGGGTIDMCRGNSNSMNDFGLKKMNLFGLPFIFRDRDHLWKVLHSEIGDEILAEPQEVGSGMVGLGWLDEGSRNFFTIKDKPINSIEDFKGLKLR
ncbi:MAG: TRAP transporter substrate-binding protein DctP, partial [Lawsonibacter sp.]|nr:TRAP transporter substrate-binding protein DctP [Lawsonibacter sp.]